jgi:hypothetical protein
MVAGLKEKVTKAEAYLNEANEKLDKNKSELYVLNLRI